MNKCYFFSRITITVVLSMDFTSFTINNLTVSPPELLSEIQHSASLVQNGGENEKQEETQERS